MNPSALAKRGNTGGEHGKHGENTGKHMGTVRTRGNQELCHIEKLTLFKISMVLSYLLSKIRRCRSVKGFIGI